MEYNYDKNGPTITYEEMYEYEKERADILERKCAEAFKECDIRKKDIVEKENVARTEREKMILERERLRGIIQGMCTVLGIELEL